MPRDKEKERSKETEQKSREKRERVVTIRHARDRGGKFRPLSKEGRATLAMLDVEIGKLKTERKESPTSVEGKLARNAEHERQAFESYAKQSLNPDLSAKEAATVSKLATTEAGHVVTNTKLLEDRAKEPKP